MNQTTFLSGGTPRRSHNAADTSLAAAEKVSTKVPSIKARIYESIRATGLVGLTTDEVMEDLKLLAQTASARVNDLHAKDKLIVDSGRRRDTRSKSPAIVWIAADLARQEYRTT